MARDYDSYIFRKGVSPNTHSVISSKNRIFAYNSDPNKGLTQIGVVATFDPSEARTIEPIRGIGFGDHIAELVPGVTDPMTISVSRSALYLSNIYQVFGYKAGIDGIVRSLKHHRWPFDIRQEVIFSAIAAEKYANTAHTSTSLSPLEQQTYKEGTGNLENYQALITVYEACWMSDYSVSFASDTAMVQETVTINVSDILASDNLSEANYAEAEPYSVLDTDQNGRSIRLRQTNQG